MSRPTKKRIEEIREEVRMQGGGGMEGDLLAEIDAFTTELTQCKQLKEADNTTLKQLTEEYRLYKIHYDRVFEKSIVIETNKFAELVQERDQLRARCEGLTEALNTVYECFIPFCLAST